MLHDPKSSNGQPTKAQGHSTTTKPNRKANAPTYEEAVTEIRDICKRMDRDQMRIGELTSLITARGDDRALAQLAEDTGITAVTLKRYRSVYRAWEGIKAPGLSYAVMRALQDVKEREQIVKDNPHITKRQAEKLAGKPKGKTKSNKSDDWTRDGCKLWESRLLSLAKDFNRTAVVPQKEEAMRILREIAEPVLVLPVLNEVFTKLVAVRDFYLALANLEAPES